MIRHIVMWKLKNKDSSCELKERLMNLVGKIPEIIDMEVGININPNEGAYDAVLNSTFNSMEDLEKYQKNPLHVEVSEFCKSIREARVVVDYEI